MTMSRVVRASAHLARLARREKCFLPAHELAFKRSVSRTDAIITLAAVTAMAVLTQADAAQARILRSGDCGPAVASVQSALALQRYDTGAASGCYGPATSAAVSAFQQARGLASTGLANAATLRALRRAQPPRPIMPGRGSWIEIDKHRQLLLVVRSGRVAAAYAVSTGQPGFETPSGRFVVTRKEVNSWSVPYGVWMPWASYFAGGVAVHAGELPGRPASHGCVRVPQIFAASIYRRMPLGTRVVVY
jgi:lipoprotein-anchoring transpeptidase ErfK/SrfK